MAKFDYTNEEHTDAVFNYLSSLLRGLKTRQITLASDRDTLHFELPDRVRLTVSAETSGNTGSLVVALDWPPVAGDPVRADAGRRSADPDGAGS